MTHTEVVPVATHSTLDAQQGQSTTSADPRDVGEPGTTALRRGLWSPAGGRAVRCGQHRRSRSSRFRFSPGIEEVRFRVDAAQEIPTLIEQYGYERAFLLSSSSLGHVTEGATRLADAIGERLVGHWHGSEGTWDESVVVDVIAEMREARTEVLVCLGDGSVIEFANSVQFGLSQGVRTREELRAVHEGSSLASVSRSEVRQFVVPTTFSTVVWKAPRSLGAQCPDGESDCAGPPTVSGGPRVIVYDTAAVESTPFRPLLGTGIESLDRAINVVCSTETNEFATTLALRAIELLCANLPELASDELDEDAIAACQMASWCTGTALTSVPPGVSNHLVTLLAPWAGQRSSDMARPSDMAGVMMLAQARWFAVTRDDRVCRAAAATGRTGESMEVILLDLLRELGMPTSLGEVGIDPAELECLHKVPPADLQWSRYCIRPITTGEDLIAALALVAS